MNNYEGSIKIKSEELIIKSEVDNPIFELTTTEENNDLSEDQGPFVPLVQLTEHVTTSEIKTKSQEPPSSSSSLAENRKQGRSVYFILFYLGSTRMTRNCLFVLVIMEWTKENVKAFIELYHQKTLLWNPKHPHHFNKIKKQVAWTDIANKVGRPVEQCKKKMENLLASLRREKMKVKRTVRTGKKAQEVYKSNWFAFKCLQFLLEKNNAKPSLNTMRLHEDKTVNSAEETGRTEESEELENDEAAVQNKRTKEASLKKRKGVQDSNEERRDHSFRLLRSSVNQANQIQDECFCFGNLIASKLRGYDEFTRSAMEIDILGIFQMASQGHYIQNRTLHVPLPGSNTSKSTNMSHNLQTGNTQGYDSEILSPSSTPLPLPSLNDFR